MEKINPATFKNHEKEKLRKTRKTRIQLLSFFESRQNHTNLFPSSISMQKLEIY